YRPPGKGRGHGGNAAQGSYALQQQQPDAAGVPGTGESDPPGPQEISDDPHENLLSGQWLVGSSAGTAALPVLVPAFSVDRFQRLSSNLAAQCVPHLHR